MRFGRFSNDGREYIITRFPTPRSWENYLGNRVYGLRVEETGAGYSVLPIAPGCRVTYATSGEPFSKVFYLRDRDSGRHWSLTWQPVGADYQAFECRHGLGYAVFAMARDEIESELRVVVPPDDPVEIWHATVRNTGASSRRLTLFPYVEWHLAPYTRPWDNYRNYVASHWMESERLIVGELNDPANPGNAFVGFAGVDPAPPGFDCEREAFIGNGSLAAPAAVVEGRCRKSDMPGDGRAVAAFAVDLDLRAGEEADVTLLIGFGADPAERRALRDRYLAADKAGRALEQVRERWSALEQQIRVSTPDPRLDRMTNLWLKANIEQLAGVIREGTRGYRDTIQDALGVVSFQPETARHLILEALSYQYPDGHAPRQFCYNGGPHDLRVYNDSPLWLVLSVARYLKETGELAFLDEQAAFFEASERAGVFEHLRRAVDWVDQRRGHHGLIRIDRGDWCDALDGVGPEGRGVSVWLSQAFHLALLEIADMCRLRGDEAAARSYLDRAGELRERIERHAWDGNWYLCAISDRGRRLGGKGEPAMEIYLNSQSWAVIGGTGAPDRVARALDSTDERLDSPFGPLLLDPPFRRYDPEVGRLSVLRPGCGENGTVYVHAAVFYLLANLMARRPERALEILRRIAPMMEEHDPELTWAAPYSYVNSYVGPCHSGHAGRTLTNWYTSCASWTLLAISDWLLGVRPTHQGLLIDPCLPSEWEQASLWRAWRGADYEVIISKPKGAVGGRVRVTVDDEEQASNLVAPHGDGRLHRVVAEVAAV